MRCDRDHIPGWICDAALKPANGSRVKVSTIGKGLLRQTDLLAAQTDRSAESDLGRFVLLGNRVPVACRIDLMSARPGKQAEACLFASSRNFRLRGTVPRRRRGGVGRTIPHSTSEADMTRHVSRISSRIGAINVLLMLVAFAMFASPAYASTPFAWSPPQPIAAPGVVDLTHVACAPSSTLCVASDFFDGDIAASMDATGGAGGWIMGNIDGRAVESLGGSLANINGIACPSTTLCVAVDDSGHILSATHPAESAAAWKRLLPTASEGHALTSIACPSTTLCVVADNDGTVLISTDPSGGSEAWTATRLAAIPETVGCETPTLCVAVSITGQIMTSSNPAGGESAWTSPTESVDASHPPLRHVMRGRTLRIHGRQRRCRQRDEPNRGGERMDECQRSPRRIHQFDLLPLIEPLPDSAW